MFTIFANIKQKTPLLQEKWRIYWQVIRFLTLSSPFKRQIFNLFLKSFSPQQFHALMKFVF